MTILDSLYRRVRNEELVFLLDINSVRMLKLVMSKWLREPMYRITPNTAACRSRRGLPKSTLTISGN